MRSPNFVRGNNRLMAVIEDTLLISSAKYDGTVGQHPESYHKALDSKGVEHIMHDIPDGFHGETFVRLHMYNFLKYIFKAK